MDKRMIRIARKVYSAERRQQAMAERQLADEATEGGFMSQVSTNLVSRAQSATKAVRQLIIAPEISPLREGLLLERGKEFMSSERDKLERSAEKLRSVIKELEERKESPPH